MTIESSTILLNHPWSSSNRSITYDISFPRLSSKIYRISCHELATRYISLSSPHLLSINHKKGKEERKKYSWNQRVRGKARNNSIYVESTLSLIEGKVRTQKFTQSTKSTVRQGSTQRLIPLREEPLLLNGGACFLSRRSLPRHRSRDVDSSISKRPPPPSPPFCVIITACYNYHGKHGQDPRSFLRTFPTFLSSLSCEILLVSFRPCRGNFLPICSGCTSPCKSIRGVYSLEIVRGRGCWELNRFCSIIF